jgi:putative restriction endonuclease
LFLGESTLFTSLTSQHKTSLLAILSWLRSPVVRVLLRSTLQTCYASRVVSAPFSEPAARLVVFQWLENLRLRFGDVIPRVELERGAPLAAATGGIIRVIGPQGIFKPRDFELPLSITTSPDSPYADAFSAAGYLLYKYRANHPDNVGLRQCGPAEHPVGLPMINGRYLADAESGTKPNHGIREAVRLELQHE